MGFSHLGDSFLHIKALSVPRANVAPGIRGPSGAPPKFEIGSVVAGLVTAPARLPKAVITTAVRDGAEAARHGLDEMGHALKGRPDKAAVSMTKGMLQVFGSPFRAAATAAFGSSGTTSRTRTRRRSRTRTRTRTQRRR